MSGYHGLLVTPILPARAHALEHAVAGACGGPQREGSQGNECSVRSPIAQLGSAAESMSSKLRALEQEAKRLTYCSLIYQAVGQFGLQAWQRISDRLPLSEHQTRSTHACVLSQGK